MRRYPGLSAPTFTSPARTVHSSGVSRHTNGLVREQFPKPTDFRTAAPAKIRRVRDALNDRPPALKPPEDHLKAAELNN